MTIHTAKESPQVYARILGRKGIFAARIRRLPIFKWLFTMLGAADRHRLEWDVVKAALELDFPPLEAERQLDSIVDWGRYAEVIAYDDSAARLGLEANGEAAAPSTAKNAS